MTQRIAREEGSQVKERSVFSHNLNVLDHTEIVTVVKLVESLYIELVLNTTFPQRFKEA